MGDTPESARQKYLKALEEKKQQEAEDKANKLASQGQIGRSIKDTVESVVRQQKLKEEASTEEEIQSSGGQKARRPSVLKTLGGVMGKAKDFIPSKAKTTATLKSESPAKTPLTDAEIEAKMKDQLAIQIAYCINQYQSLISLGGSVRLESKGLTVADKDARNLDAKEYAKIAEEFKKQFNASQLHPFHEVDGFIAMMMQLAARRAPLYEDTFMSVFNFDANMNDQVLALAGGIINQLHVKEQRVEVKPPPLPRSRPKGYENAAQTPLKDLKEATQRPPLPPRDDDQTGDGRPRTKMV